VNIIYILEVLKICPTFASLKVLSCNAINYDLITSAG